MIKSMTGFGIAEAQTPSYEITVEVKTLNSKFLDLTLRLPKLLNQKEIEIRNIINDELIRGKISIAIQVNEKSSEAQPLSVNESLFNSYYNQLQELEKNTGRTFSDILKIALESPEVISYKESAPLNEVDYLQIKEVIINAINDCNTHRIQEGDTVSSVLISYIKQIEKALEIVVSLEPKRLEKIREKLKANLSELVGSINYDKDRLEQELIYYSEKLDVNEEIERLRIHLNYFRDTLYSKAPSHGKKLGFITQEMGREINTLGSKANDSNIQEQVILMKEELEKIKEQILNIL